MKRTNQTGDPKNAKHLDLGGGWHLLHIAQLGLATIVCDPSGKRFNFSANPSMSREEARKVIRELTDATPAQKTAYLALLDGEHLKGEEARQ